MSDIRVKFSFMRHRKRKKLQHILGAEGVIALIDLWLSTAECNPKGILNAYDEHDIAIDANYTGDAKEFTDTLVDLGFLDKIDNGYALHDWEDNQGWVFHSDERSAKAKKAAKARWDKYNDATSNATSNAPSPSPTPNPTPTPAPAPEEWPIEDTQVPF